MNLNASKYDEPEFTETTFGRKLERMEWRKGELWQCFSEKYEQYAGRRFLGGGEREVWEKVPGDTRKPVEAIPPENAQAMASADESPTNIEK